MADREALNKYWKDSGKTKTFIANKANVSRPRLDYIFNHPETATAFQVKVLCMEMSIPEDNVEPIFMP